MKTITIFLTSLILAFPNFLFSQSEMLDATFDFDGKVTTDIGTNTDMIFSIAIQNDGKIVAAGSAKIEGESRFSVLRYNTDGSLDNTFGTNGIVITAIGQSNAASAVAIQSDGKIVVGGYTYNGDMDFAVVRYNVDGSLDNTFSNDGKATTGIGLGNDKVRSMVIQQDGKIILAGKVTVGFLSHIGLARFTTNGDLDNTFDNDGVLTTVLGALTGDINEATSIALQSDGKIMITGGYIPLLGHQNGVPLIRYNSNGSLDHTFGNGGKLITHGATSLNVGKALAIQSDGKFLVASENKPNSLDYDFVLLRYNTNGTPDNTFGSNGIAISDLYGEDDRPTSMVIQPDGKIVVAGSTSVGSSSSNFGVARYLSNGSLDNSFGSGGKLWTDFGTSVNTVGSVALQADGKIIVGGSISTSTSTSDFALARYTAGLVTGIIDLPSIGSAIIYPNPTNDKILFTTKKMVDINIYNYSGQIIRSLNNNNGRVDVSDLNNGIYFLQLTIPDTKVSAIYKFVKD